MTLTVEVLIKCSKSDCDVVQGSVMVLTTRSDIKPANVEIKVLSKREWTLKTYEIHTVVERLGFFCALCHVTDDHNFELHVAQVGCHRFWRIAGRFGA